MKGCKPKSTAELKLSGSRRLSLRAAEPDFQGVPRKPDWLTPYAQEVWDRVIPDLIEQGVTRRVDQDALCGYCEAAASLRSATEIIAREGLTTIGMRGEVKKHPAVTIQNEAMAMLARYSAEFGLTGASRSKVKSSKVKKEEEGKGRFFGSSTA